jgi:hypothetical protein
MAADSKPCDVFVANSASDAPIATAIAVACRASGLEAVTNADLPLGMETSDAVRDALAESRAVIVIVPPSGPTASMWMEIGAAQAWNKPIFGVIGDPAIPHLPPLPSDVKIYALSRIDEIIGAIKQTARQMTDHDRSLLAELYAEAGATVDQLIRDPQLLERLAGRFNKRAGKTVAEERLHSELLRMRKEGTLKKRPRARPGPRIRTT